uniref:oligopeptide:H+ symporter n=1 Tax=Novosphingobium sp. TaxID=1874826 RepID=UPI00286B5A0A
MNAQAGQSQLFGHPRGLTVLATTHLWERFSFWGMQVLLMLYMTKYLLLPEHARNVLGLGAFRAALVSIFGPMTDLAFAAQIAGLYSGLLYGTPLIGAWLGDRVLGRTRTVTIGCLMMSAGHLAMASEQLFLPALILIILGGGGVIGNMSAQIGLLYAPDDHRRTRAFGIYLITLNIGALIAPLIIGTLGEKVSWHWGFGAAGIGMVIGLITYLAGRRHLPPDQISQRGQRAKLSRAEWRKVAALLCLLIPYCLYNAAAFQAYGIMYVWADKAVDRTVLGWEVPVTWIGIVDGILTIVGIIIATRIWNALEKRGREPHDFTKLAIGYAGIGAAFLFAAAIALLPLVPIALWIGFFILLDLWYGWADPPLQALVSRDSPASVTATMMALLSVSTMFSFFLIGWMGRFFWYFEQVDFKQMGLDQEILRDIANSIDKDLENLPDAQLRKLCRDLISLLLENKKQWSSAWTKGKSNDYNESLKPDYPLYGFIADIAKITPNQIIYQPHCRLGAMFIKFSNEFSDYNLQFIGQDFHSHGETFTCKINLFANRLENVSSIYLGNPLNILENQVKTKADIAIATNYPLGSLYPTEDYINVSHLETGEKINSYEVAYIELMLAMTKDDGKVIILVPDSFLMSNQ